ncbi:bifunctional aconitate hydratase 2/2-methylisocitrate dehydratase [Campylobacter sp. RM9344]|uniref:Aconitate hydratase B n=1 Tax=Campylobacter californiensis TaxID=1032243 RepID=A0AAW3ZZ57_9BACT|nr:MULTISPECIES: bifunctional aconitate hydratase 2/2-methylisocitrate dehydratase [unclassified Campylobacter]MBE2985295.1 bifunctional aconitate hydratase 2/2-methylisocitrate dehydratase [Campylobacter sp. RM6883]MBE2987133.1 bifunctional aconitate hydratase 2/2-methylisocitrate dehydratase [Campylobacter sp. RM12919]MBE2988811.1 bifunctional aconitate hydratase 2/2-methylisocitrate dehydratase [Campylobacter sp. RM12920]MBE2995936.1 bifunctional aconitate hydratase 2/2-methylisocitrate dehy
MDFLIQYKKHIDERAKLGVPPLALNQDQTVQVCEILRNTKNENEAKEFIELLSNRVNPGVDDAAKVKAEFLGEIVNSGLEICGIDKIKAIEILSKMLGGYNVAKLILALKNSDENVAKAARDALKNSIFVNEYFNEILDLSKTNKFALEILNSWAKAEWFLKRESLSECIKAVVFKVAGETNTDDLSPASEAFTRSDIPLHANAMLVKRQPGSLEKISELKSSGREVVYVGDVVGTGSSRKSGINSIQWHLGRDIDGVPNKKTGGVVIGTSIAPIFFNTAQDSGALPIIADVSALETGDEIEIYPYKGEIVKNGEVVAKFNLSPNTLIDEIRAGGRIPLIIARALCVKARNALNLAPENIFTKPDQPKDDNSYGYSLAQKIVGRACGVKGVRPNTYVEPVTLTVGSQDTTGPMTRDEIKELASLGFSADFVLQSFCHTAAYPKPSDEILHATLPNFMNSRGGVSLKPGDGVIHSWLNRMVLPDTLGTGGDSHTRFPIGISFPAGSGLVAFAAVLGVMPLNMPQSVLVRFSGKLKEGITLRDLVNAIPYYAIKRGLLSVEKKNKKNIFAGKILEIEGLENLKVEQAFELSDASAERSAAACVVALNNEPVIEYLRSNVALIDAMIKAGYENRQTLERRRDKMLEWLKNPTLLKADKDAQYAEIIEINLDDISEPILACPNDPDDVATLSEILADQNRAKEINEVFVGSCMTNIGHYRALAQILKDEKSIPTRLWVVPPTKMDKVQLESEGCYDVFKGVNARVEVPGCSLCMGNQARVEDNAVVFSTSTRNFDNRMGMGAKVYLGSAELAAVCAILGRLPSVDEYKQMIAKKIVGKESEIYRYLNFNEIKDFYLH